MSNSSFRNKTLLVQSGKLYISTIIVLAFVSLGLLTYEYLNPDLSKDMVKIFGDLDLAIAYIFIADFFVGLWACHRKRHYAKSNWLNLASSIPISNSVFRLFRGLRFIRAYRGLKGVVQIEQVIVHHDDREKPKGQD